MEPECVFCDYAEDYGFVDDENDILEIYCEKLDKHFNVCVNECDPQLPLKKTYGYIDLSCEP